MPGDRDTSSARTALAQAETAFHAGRFAETIAQCERALAQEPRLIPALLLLSAAAQRQGNLKRALAVLEQVAVLAPNSAQSFFNLGAVRSQIGDIDGAIAALEKSLAMQASPATRILLAEVCNARGNAAMPHDPVSAASDFDRAVTLAPGEAGYRLNLGNALIAAGDVARAIDVLRQAVARSAGLVEARISLSAALIEAGQMADAIREAERAVRDSGGDMRARLNLASALVRSGRGEEGVSTYLTIVAAEPGETRAWLNLGNALQELARLDEAVAAYDRALAIDPASLVARQQRGLALLLAGRLGQGWKAFLERDSMQLRAHEFWRAPLPADLHGRTVLLRRDQGLGDEIFFLRFVPALKARGARVFYEPGSKLVQLLQHHPLLDGVVSGFFAGGPADHVVASGDLPYVLGCGDADWPPSIVLTPSPAALAAADRILRTCGPPPYVGVTWRAGTANDKRALFKETPFDGLAAALAPLTATVVSLQREPRAGEVGDLAHRLGRTVADLAALNEDLATMLALLARLDDYVCVSNTNVHLRQAAARPSRVLIPTPEFRWRAAGGESSWFLGTRLYRRSPDRTWTAAFATLSRDLSARFAVTGAGVEGTV
ncbi:MAG: tetratricopeptide repeat protein [Alphaproteobacteria bacterium]|nr:tetratricopeptide repeat protein [Alphaproteobacteria bacterium]